MTTPRLGPWMATALVVGNMIGSGVFLIPASLAPYGWNAVFGWLLTIAGSLALAFVLARLARSMPQGSPYHYVKAAFGPFPAFLMAWTYWISVWITNAAIAVAAIAYGSVLFPALASSPLVSGAAAVSVIWLFTLVSARGARTAGGVQVVTTIIKIIPLLAVVVIAFAVIGSGTAAPAPLRSTDISFAAITATASLTLWAMLGFECATLPAGKIADPERTIPRATMGGALATGLIYLFACSAVTLLLPAEVVAQSNAPFAEYGARFVGTGVSLAIAAFASIGALGALNGWILVQGEIPLALARDGVFPRWFAAVNDRGSPVRALILSSFLATLLVASNYSRSLGALFVFMALFATVNTLVLYLLCALAALKLKRIGQLPGGWIVPIAILGTLFSIWTFYGAGTEACLWGLASIASGVPVYLLMRRSRVRELAPP